eukprot:1609611-Alexandrium_andersonii.AAC.1
MCIRDSSSVARRLKDLLAASGDPGEPRGGPGSPACRLAPGSPPEVCLPLAADIGEELECLPAC